MVTHRMSLSNDNDENSLQFQFQFIVPVRSAESSMLVVIARSIMRTVRSSNSSSQFQFQFAVPVQVFAYSQRMFFYAHEESLE